MACNDRKGVVTFVRSNAVLVLLLVGITAGVCLGAVLRQTETFSRTDDNPKAVMLLGLPGELLIRVVQLATAPLLVSSIISAVSRLDLATSGRIGIRTFVFYVSTTTIAATEGILWYHVFIPGFDLTEEAVSNATTRQPEDQTFLVLDMLRNAFPDNLVGAAIYNSKTEVTYDVVEGVDDSQNISKMLKIKDINVGTSPGANMLGLAVFSIAIGITMASMRSRAEPIINISVAVFEVTMKAMKALLWVYPVGVVFLMARSVVQIESIHSHVVNMGLIFAASLTGLFIHTILVLPLILWLFTRRNPYIYMKGIFKTLVTAFATSSSAMTLPVTLDTLENENHVDPRITNLVCPLGANVNMDGMALYYAMALLFLLRLYGRFVGAKQVLTTTFLVIGISVGIPGVPGTIGIVIILLEAVQLPAEAVVYVLPYDWLLTRFRTMTNVWGDCVGAGVVEAMSRKELKQQDMEQKEKDEGMQTLGELHTVHSTELHTVHSTEPQSP